ncbi:MAG TPA: DUF4190 domain-containing protein [Anaerolineales bacterium]|nr:DUF4190 domain-containing protein [Anaerolineales bacterium]
MTEPSAPPSPPIPTGPQTSTLAIVSLVAGILTWLIVPVLGAIAAIVTGHMARNEIRKSPERLTGNGLATAGLVLGYGQIIFLVVPVCLIVVLALMGPAIGNVFSNIVTSI